MLSKNVIEKIIQNYSTKTLVVEGANGALGISLAMVLKKLGIKPPDIILTTFNSDLSSEWADVANNITLLKSSDKDFIKQREKHLSTKKTQINVIYGAGYSICFSRFQKGLLLFMVQVILFVSHDFRSFT